MSTQTKNTEIESFIERESTALIMKARNMAMEAGRSNSPPVHAPTIAPYIYPLKIGFRAIFKNTQTILNEQKLKTLSDIDLEHQTSQARETDEMIREVSNRIKLVTDKLERVSNDGYNWLVGFVVLVVFAGLLYYEARMNSSFIMAIARDITLGDARKISVFMYLAITLCIMAVHHFTSYIATRFWRKVLIGSAYSVIALFFIGIAYVRVVYLNEGQFSFLSFVFFAVINLVFLAAISFLHSFAPTRVQFSNFLSRMVFQWKIDRLKAKLKRLTQKHKDHLRTGENIVRSTQESLHSIQHYKSILSSKYELCLSEFVNFNISTRTDGLVPTIFQDIESQKIDFE